MDLESLNLNLKTERGRVKILVIGLKLVRKLSRLATCLITEVSKLFYRKFYTSLFLQSQHIQLMMMREGNLTAYRGIWAMMYHTCIFEWIASFAAYILYLGSLL